MGLNRKEMNSKLRGGIHRNACGVEGIEIQGTMLVWDVRVPGDRGGRGGKKAGCFSGDGRNRLDTLSKLKERKTGNRRGPLRPFQRETREGKR